MTLQDSLAPGMGRCSITGKIVPEDELVTISGQRVCAEGKVILLERLKSGEAMPGEMEKPRVLQRFGAMFVDGLIVVLPFAILTSVMTANGTGAMALGLISIVGTVVQLAYFGMMHAARGQTVGKKAAKLVVVNLDGSPISANSAYLRAAVYIGPNLLTGLATLSGNVGLMGPIAIIVGVYSLVNIVVALVDGDQQRAIHDRVAGTREIQKN